jgi:hypothetical protein
MILRGVARHHSDSNAEAKQIEVTCDNDDEGRRELHAQVPDAWDLLHITVASA